MRKMETIADREHKSSWIGRSLENYKAMHRQHTPEVDRARSLTEARRIAFGEKVKKVGVCGCKQPGCERYGRGKSDAC